MTLRRVGLWGILFLLPSSVLNADTLVIRDSIGADTSLTNGLGGGVTLHDGIFWNTPGLVVNVPEDGELTEARFVIFARGPEAAGSPPENNLANMYGYPMEFNVWTDGIEIGADSFDENPLGLAVPGHIDIDVNTSTTSYITVVPFGHTGPTENPNMFTTFLVTIDLSSFNLALEGGPEYVMGIIQDNDDNFITGGGFVRVSASWATGFEDVFRGFDTTEIRPGYVDSQHDFGYEQLGGSFTLTTFAPGDYDFDSDVDDDDYDKWRSEFGTTSFKSDGNDDDLVDAADYVVWRKHLPTMAAATSSSAATIPEPGSAFLLLVAATIAFLRVRNS